MISGIYIENVRMNSVYAKLSVNGSRNSAKTGKNVCDVFIRTRAQPRLGSYSYTIMCVFCKWRMTHDYMYITNAANRKLVTQ